MRTFHNRLLFLLTVLLALSPFSHAQIRESGTGAPGPVKALHLIAELISDSGTIAPGGRSRVALALTLDPGWHAKFRENVRDVALHGLFSNCELGCNRFVRVPARDQSRAHIDFACSQVVIRGMVSQLRGDLGGIRFCPAWTARMVSRSSLCTCPSNT